MEAAAPPIPNMGQRSTAWDATQPCLLTKNGSAKVKRHKEMLELTVMGGSPSHLGPRETDPEEVPHIGATPRHLAGFFPLSITATGQREGPLKGVTL